MKTSMNVLLALFLFAPAALADDPGIGGGPHEASTVDLGGPEAGFPAITTSLFVLPDGSGRTLDQVFVLNGGGAVTDATIHITVIHPYQGAMPGFPAEDVWLEGASGGLAVCGGDRFTADGPADAEARMTISGSPRAGGWDAQGLRLFFAGAAWIGPDLPIVVNSADIDGDGRVNLTDTGFFANDLFFGPYSLRSDFNGDWVINLTDAGMMIDGIGRSCF